MEEEHQGSRTPASVRFTSPTRSATPGERPSPAYRGVGAARDPDEPTRVAVLANLPTARVVEAGVPRHAPAERASRGLGPGPRRGPRVRAVHARARARDVRARAPRTKSRGETPSERWPRRRRSTDPPETGGRLGHAVHAQTRAPASDSDARGEPRGVPVDRAAFPPEVLPPIPTRAGARVAARDGGGGGIFRRAPGRLDRARGGRPLPRGKP